MDSKWQQEKHHIRAARDWLVGAEESLDGANDVRGELKLMLAKAELAHVGEERRKNILRKAGALCVTLLLAVGLGALYLGGAETTAPAQTVAGSAGETATATATTAPADAAAPVSAPAAPPTPVAPAAAVSAQIVPAVPAAPAVQVAPAPAPTVREAPSAAIPDEHKQKLMQTAGSVLRK